jgi:transketolase C-terminal domain/subunit
MRVMILRDLQTRSGRMFREGRQHDLSAGEARVLIRRGVARAVRAAKPLKRRAASEAGTADRTDG